MTNPFLAIDAGVFCAAFDPSGPTTLAEHICAGMAQAISNDPAQPLSAGVWSYAVSQLPQAVTASQASGEVEFALQETLASACIGPAIAAFLPNARAELARWIAAQPRIARLNTLVVAPDSDGRTRVSLTFLGQETPKSAQNITFSREELIIDSSAPIQTQLGEIFGDKGTLRGQPYYCPLTPIS